MRQLSDNVRVRCRKLSNENQLQRFKCSFRRPSLPTIDIGDDDVDMVDSVVMTVMVLNCAVVS